jgi:hypothetical protein
LLNGRLTSLFKKGLSENALKLENDAMGVINRRNGCGSTILSQAF